LDAARRDLKEKPQTLWEGESLRYPLLALRHIVTSQVEHSSVLNYCMALCSGGFTPPFRSGEFTSPRWRRKAAAT